MHPPEKRKPAAGTTGFLEIMSLSTDLTIHSQNSELAAILQELRVLRRRPGLSGPVARLLASHCYGAAA